MFHDGSQHIEDSGCGCQCCEPEHRCDDCGIGLESGDVCVDCAGERAADAVGAQCAALCLDFMLASNRIAAVDDRGPANDLGLAVAS